MEPILKKNIKLDKVLKKRQNTKSQAPQITQNLPEDNNNTDKEYNIGIQYIDPQIQTKKAKQWWQILDNNYYRPIKRKNILLARDLTSAEKLINFFSIQEQFHSSFQNEEIFQNCPLLRQNTLINVLFKSSTPFLTQLMSFSFVNYIQNLSKRGIKSGKEQNGQDNVQQTSIIISCMKKLKNPGNLTQIQDQQLQQTLKIGNLQFQSSLTNEVLLCKIQRAQKIKYQMQFDEEIDVEIELWENEALRQNTQNSILWNNLLANHTNNIEIQPLNFSSQVFYIKQQLMHHTILRYLQHGTRDKTQQMLKQLLDNMKQLKPAKARDSSNKKFFETDCKICFCSFNSDSNQVLYCDMCNTSFHLACYGLHEVPQQKEYFCDRCTAIKKDEKTKNNTRKISCQICCKPNFPIKQIDGHYYHMTCLIIFNFITLKQGRIRLRQGFNHQIILRKVIQSQMQCKACIFCLGYQGAETGMQFRCSVQGCDSSMHPICAYINGCLFDVKRNMKEKKIEVGIFCNKHDYERDYIQQTYLRRYMCNFKNTSQKPLQLFRAEYQAETLSRKQKLKSRPNPNSQPLNLIFDSKIIKKHIAQRQQKNLEKTQEFENTETRKLLQRLKNKQ